MNRTIFSVTLAAFLMVSLTSTAKAATFISYWKNQTKCTYKIENNGASPVTLDPGQSIDFGPFPTSDPLDLRVTPSEGSGCAPAARIAYGGSVPGKTCGRNDPGPFKLTVTSGGNDKDLCYCVNLGRFAYINVRVTSSGANLEIGPNAYECGNPI